MSWLTQAVKTPPPAKPSGNPLKDAFQNSARNAVDKGIAAARNTPTGKALEKKAVDQALSDVFRHPLFWIAVGGVILLYLKGRR